MNDGLTGLPALEASLGRDFARLNLPPKPWVPEIIGPDKQTITDVVIVGGGMCGLAAAFALRCAGITRIRHIDRQEKGQEGPWLSYARMKTLRSPKHLTGPVVGIPNLTFRAWFEAQYGDTAWEELEHIDRPQWMEYLQWYRRISFASIENNVRVNTLRPSLDSVEVNVTHANNRQETFHARQVVLATGREGQSRARIPAPFKELMGSQVQHASAAINFNQLSGKHVAVIGLAASAFDNAATALESKAAKVTLIGRSATLPRLNKMKQTVFPGFTHGYAALPDEHKLRIMRHIAEARVAPPRKSVLRVAGKERMNLLLGSTVTEVKKIGQRYQINTGSATLLVDHVILGTGFAIDLDTPAETAMFAKEILRWQDKFPHENQDEWLQAPYLTDGFEFCSREQGSVPGINRIRCFNHAAQLSLGNLANDIPAVGEGARQLANAITQSFFVDDRDYHWDKLVAYDDAELLGDEWP
jgi:cation diffusion facilitator CzcD-associated flavoprotein CzcO